MVSTTERVDDPNRSRRCAAPAHLVLAQVECYTRRSAASRHPSRWRGAAANMEEVVAVLHPDSVDVSIDGGVLTVTAQRSERTEHDVQWLNSERFTGGYMRRLSLGQDIDVDHIAATYQNGVLTVTLPVAARAEPRHIEITPGAPDETKVIEPSDPSDQHTTT